MKVEVSRCHQGQTTVVRQEEDAIESAVAQYGSSRTSGESRAVLELLRPWEFDGGGVGMGADC